MPSYTAKELADICSIAQKNVHTYALRGKLVKSRDGLFDVNNPINAAFVDKFTTRDKTTAEVEHKTALPLLYAPTPPPQVQQSVEPEVKQARKRGKPKQSDDDDQPTGYVSASKLNDLRAQKLKEEITQLSLKNQRLEGELVEVEIIEKVTLEVIKAYRSTLFLAAENVLKNNMIDLGANNDKLTNAVSDLQVLFNAGCSSAIEQVKQAISQVV